MGGRQLQVSAKVCYEINFSDRYRGSACVLFKLWQVPPLKFRHYGGIQMRILILLFFLIPQVVKKPRVKNYYYYYYYYYYLCWPMQTMSFLYVLFHGRANIWHCWLGIRTSPAAAVAAALVIIVQHMPDDDDIIQYSISAWMHTYCLWVSEWVVS